MLRVLLSSRCIRLWSSRARRRRAVWCRSSTDRDKLVPERRLPDEFHHRSGVSLRLRPSLMLLGRVPLRDWLLLGISSRGSRSRLLWRLQGLLLHRRHGRERRPIVRRAHRHLLRSPLGHRPAPLQPLLMHRPIQERRGVEFECIQPLLRILILPFVPGEGIVVNCIGDTNRPPDAHLCIVPHREMRCRQVASTRLFRKRQREVLVLVEASVRRPASCGRRAAAQEPL